MKRNELYVELTPELLERASKKLQKICKEGCTKNGISESYDPSVIPDWYDKERFKRGQSVIIKHYTGLINGMVVGLLVFLQLPVGLAPLLSTGKSKNLAKLFKRYFDTFQFIDEWYHSDPFNKDSKSCQTLTVVRSLHKNAHKMMNEKISVFEFAKNVFKENNQNLDDKDIEKYIRHKDRIWISQYDMALVQWSFLGCAVLEPEASALHGITKEQMLDILYFWRVISYKLGIEEEYSLIDDKDYEFTYVMCKQILEQEYIFHMENVAAPLGVRMSEGVLFTFKDILIGSNCNVYLKYWYSILNVNSYKINRTKYEHDKIEFFELPNKIQLSEEEKKIMCKNGFNDKYVVTDYNLPFEKFKLNGLKERMLYYCYLVVINWVLKFDWGKNFTRGVVRNAMYKTRAARKEITTKLEQIKNERFEFSECPFTNGGINTIDHADLYATS